MRINITPITGVLLLLILYACNSPEQEAKENTDRVSSGKNTTGTNGFKHLEFVHDDGDVYAVIEIPSGTLEKWEFNKSTGQVEKEQVNGKLRIVNYLGYPANYGIIPKTLLSKENGGDGDPLDIIVLGPPEERGSVIKGKVIGVLYLVDRGEQDDKLVAVSTNSPLYKINGMDELNQNYIGISRILQLWFTNYKGPGKMESKGFGDRDAAIDILRSAVKEYKLNIKNTRP